MTSVAEHEPVGVESYSGIAKFLHWLIAFCILIMIPIGIIMVRIGSGDVQNLLYNIHRSFGVLVLALMLIRLIYRLAHGVPAPEPTITAWQRAVSHLVHLALYALVIAQAMIGWVATSAYDADIWFFGLFIMPDLVSKDQALAEPLFAVHDALGFTIAGLLTIHIGAALYHHVIRKDNVLKRMLP